MNTYQKVVCDECSKEFNLSEKNIKKHYLEKDKAIEETYFMCPKCKHKYVISVTDEEVINLMNNSMLISMKANDLLKISKDMMKKAREKSLELEKQWKQQS